MPENVRDTVIVPAREEAFRETFLGQSCWYPITISEKMLPRIKYIAAYRTAPTSAITHWAAVDHIEPYGDEGRYRLVFACPARELFRLSFGVFPWLAGAAALGVLIYALGHFAGLW